MDMDFVGTFELEYGRMVDFSRIIDQEGLTSNRNHEEGAPPYGLVGLPLALPLADHGVL